MTPGEASRSLGAAVVTVGDELLSGRTVDTNAAGIGRWCADRGIPVVARWTVGDHADDIHAAVRAALGRASLVIVTGGLGPTRDDLTRDAVADLLGRPLEVDAGVLETIRRRFEQAGRGQPPDVNRRLAQRPRGARILQNPVGTAPGLAMDEGDALVVLLPGVPGEVRAILAGGLDEEVRRRFGARLRPVWVRHIHTTGIPESELAERLEGSLPEEGAVRVAFLPGERGVDLRLTAAGRVEQEALQHLDAVEEAVNAVVRPWRFDAPESGDLVEAVLEALRRRALRVALAESCTGGLVAKRLTDMPGASDVVMGGVVAYADQAKLTLLGVDSALLTAHGAVSEPVALAMARGARARFGAEAAVGITGVAGPGGGSLEKPVGTVCYAVVVEDREEVRTGRFAGDRSGVRERSGQAALALLLQMAEEGGRG